MKKKSGNRSSKGPEPATKSARSRKVEIEADSGAKSNRASGSAASKLIDEKIMALGDWRGETLSRMRALILEVDPNVTEEWKWMGTPVWSHAGNICTGETYKQVVKLTFARGAALEDPHGLFNSSLEGNTRRAIDIREGEEIKAKAFKSLIEAAIAVNLRVVPSKKKAVKVVQGLNDAKQNHLGAKKKVVLLSGGNPQIAKADGNAPVQAYIAAMSGWKKELGERLDALIEKVIPQVKKAVKWNSPFYGVEGQGWFLSFHVFTKYVKVTFFSGTLLKPNPPGHTERTKDARWIDLYETDELDEVQMTKWLKQAASLPGWIP